MDTLIYLMPVLMFLALAMLLFSGFPVAFVLGGVALGFGFLGLAADVFSFIEFFNIISRIWGGVCENLILVAVPMFIFMGTMLERSGVANDLLHCLQVLLRRVPGGLAMSVTIMGTIMAATTGIIGASVVMMTLLALPVMLDRQYHPSLATGTIAASGTLGILIPPSIMLVIMADLLSISVGTLFVAAVFPGLVLASLYIVYLFFRTRLNPTLAPPLPASEGPDSAAELVSMVFRSFLPPIFLIFLVLGSIFAGVATPTEAAGVGALGSIILALFNRRLRKGGPERRGRANRPDVRHDLRDLHRRDGVLVCLPVTGRRRSDPCLRRAHGPRVMGHPVPHDGDGVPAGLLLRLGRDHLDRAAVCSPRSWQRWTSGRTSLPGWSSRGWPC